LMNILAIVTVSFLVFRWNSVFCKFWILGRIGICVVFRVCDQFLWLFSKWASRLHFCEALTFWFFESETSLHDKSSKSLLRVSWVWLRGDHRLIDHFLSEFTTQYGTILRVGTEIQECHLIDPLSSDLRWFRFLFCLWF
jgi:hypothetical protein